MEVDLYLMSENFSWHNSVSENTIYAPENKYGYRINITHPKIEPLYRRYKKWKGIADWCPLSDAERLEFETERLAIPLALAEGESHTIIICLLHNL